MNVSPRRLSEATGTLFEALDGQQAWQYETTVEVTQRGGRTARKASVQVCGRSVKLQPPAARSKGEKPWSVNGVVVRERGDGEDELHWKLLASEPVETVEQIKRIVRYYQLRWRIEEYRKAWKSGGRGGTTAPAKPGKPGTDAGPYRVRGGSIAATA